MIELQLLNRCLIKGHNFCNIESRNKLNITEYSVKTIDPYSRKTNLMKDKIQILDINWMRENTVKQYYNYINKNIQQIQNNILIY